MLFSLVEPPPYVVAGFGLVLEWPVRVFIEVTYQVDPL